MTKSSQEIAEERFRNLGHYLEEHAADLASELDKMIVAEGGVRAYCNLATDPNKVTIEKDYIATDRRPM